MCLLGVWGQKKKYFISRHFLYACNFTGYPPLYLFNFTILFRILIVSHKHYSIYTAGYRPNLIIEEVILYIHDGSTALKCKVRWEAEANNIVGWECCGGLAVSPLSRLLDRLPCEEGLCMIIRAGPERPTSFSLKACGMICSRLKMILLIEKWIPSISIL